MGNSYIIKWAKKIICINHLGGKCKCCQTDNIFVLQFHHLNDKSFDICSHKGLSLLRLFPEVEKCELYCGNCHSELEQIENGSDICLWRRKIKKRILEYKNIDFCQNCKYSGKNYASLDLHHRNSDNKSFKPIQKAAEFGLTDWVLKEIDKCDVLCKNCHTIHHIDKERFDKFKDLIYEKVHTHRSNKKIDHQLVYKLYQSGLKKSEIATKLNISKTNVYYVLNHSKLLNKSTTN